MNIVEVRGKVQQFASTLPWHKVEDKVKRLGGIAGPVITFKTQAALDSFDKWYATHAPEGLTVRARVDEPADWINGQPKTLKALRMWHWRQVLTNRAEQDKFEMLAEKLKHHPVKSRTFTEIATNTRMQANLHLSAVQVLNDVLPGTAEQDCAAEDGNG